LRRLLLRISSVFHRTLLNVVEHDCFNVAQSAAYSAMISLFPALIIAAAFIGFLPGMAPLRSQLSLFFDSILPSDVTPILEGYFATSHHNPQSVRAIIIGILVSVTGASSVIATFMEGFRRAHDLPPDCWTFWQRRARAYALVPLSLIPLAIASLLIVFGHIITTWLAMHVMTSARTPVYIIAVIVRWAVAFTGSIGSRGSVPFPVPFSPPPCGSSRPWPSAGTSPGSPTTRRSMVLWEQVSLCSSGSTSSRSAFSAEPSSTRSASCIFFNIFPID